MKVVFVRDIRSGHWTAVSVPKDYPDEKVVEQFNNWFNKQGYWDEDVYELMDSFELI